jgi:hypothetical protein
LVDIYWGFGKICCFHLPRRPTTYLPALDSWHNYFLFLKCLISPSLKFINTVSCL